MENKKTEVDYRAERKARIAKNASKSKKSGIDTYKAVKAIICVICAVLVIAAAYGVCNAYGVPQRLLPAVTVGDRTYSVAEYEYYYTSLYGSHAQQSQEFAQQYGGTSLLAALGQFDYTIHPEKQTKQTDDDTTITWAEYFDESVIEMLQSYNYYFEQCKENNIELDDTDYAEIDEMINELQTYADTYSVSLTRYLGSYYGNGMTAKLYKDTLAEQKLAEKYLEFIEEGNEAAITDEAIEAAYAADPSAFQVIDLRVFGIATDGSSVSNSTTETTTEAATESVETTEATTENITSGDATEETAKEELSDAHKEALKKAEEFYNRITDEASFIELCVEYANEEDKSTFENGSATVVNGVTKSIISSNISEELAEWLFTEDRVHGDKYYVTSNEGDYVYVIFVVKPAYREDTPKVDVRHILVSYETGVNHMDAHTQDGSEHTAEEDASFTKDVENAVEEFNLTVDYALALEQNEKYTEDVVKATYAATYDIYEAYLENATEENFATLATSYSADTSSTTANENTENGGLYEDIAKGTMVENFDKWIYDENRTKGDVGIVQTEYGFHIIYFVNQNERADWKDTVVDSLTSENDEAFNTMMENIIADKSNVTIGSFKNYAYNQSIELIEKLYTGTYITEE